MIDTDIAVIEALTGYGEWQPVAYIGPDRSDGVIFNEETGYGLLYTSLRVRYFDRRINDVEE